MQDGALLWNTLFVDIYWPLCILQYMQLCNHRCCIKSTHLVAVHRPNVLGRASPTMFSLWIWSFGSDRFLIKRGICLSLCTSHCEWQLTFQFFRFRQMYCFTYTSSCLMLLLQELITTSLDQKKGSNCGYVATQGNPTGHGPSLIAHQSSSPTCPSWRNPWTPGNCRRNTNRIQ